jgi:uncharacterized protein with von Willebrand factor type A (vWA) domain
MHEPHPLDIPEFLKRDKNETRETHAVWASHVREEHAVKHPSGWHALTKAEQDGTADEITIGLRRKLEIDRKTKQAERFAALKALNATKTKLPAAAKKFKTMRPAKTSKKTKTDSGKMERYGVATDGDLIAFSFDAKSSADSRVVLKNLRKAGKTPKCKITSLRRLRPDDKGVDGKPITHIQ